MGSGNFLKATAAALLLHCNDFRVNSAATRDAARASRAADATAGHGPRPALPANILHSAKARVRARAAVSGMTYEVS